MLSTFLIPLQELPDENSRIHCSLNLNTETGMYKVIRDGRLDQPDFSYKYKDINLKKILETA